MNKSETLGKLAEALSKAQGAMKNAIKDSANPFFKSKYADLASVADACRSELAANGLAVVQLPTMREGKMVLEYVLMHASGEFVGSELEMVPVKSDPQGIGSAITYARRYTLAGITGVATEDDDGNAASGKNGNGENKQPPKIDKTSRQSTTIGAPDGPAAASGDYITEGQRKRFFAICRDSEWTDDQIKTLLKDFGVSSTNFIFRKDYDRIVGNIERGYAQYLDAKTNPPAA